MVWHSAPTCLDRRLACWFSAQRVVPHARPTQRHIHTCFYVEPKGSYPACFKVSRHYAGDGSLRLERSSPQPGHGSLRLMRRSTDDGSLRLGYRSSQPRHGSPRTKRPPLQPRAAQ